MSDPLDALFAGAQSQPSAAPTGDPLDNAWNDDTARRAGTNIVALRAANPDQAGRANTLARETGIPADTIERNLPTVENRQQAATAQRLISQYPAIGKWAADPRHAAVGKDDMTSLGGIAKTVRSFLGSTARAIPAGVVDTMGGIYGLGRAAVETVADVNLLSLAERKMFGASLEDKVAGYLGRQQTYGGVLATDVAGAPQKNWYAQQVIQGIRSLPSTAASLAMAASGNPELGATFMGATVTGQEYGAARDKGLTPARSLAYAGVQGAIEIATERVPALKYFEDTKLGAGFGRKLVNNLMTELPQEEAATVMQDLNQWASLNPDKPFSDYLKARPSAFVSTAIATAAGATVAVTGLEVASKATKGMAKAALKQQQAQQATADAAFLDNLATSAADSKVRKRDPEAFARFIDLHSAGTTAENVHIPGEKVAEFFQSQGMDWHDPDHAWGYAEDFAGQVDQALATGGDVVVPTSQVAAHLTGTPAWDALKDHARLSPAGMSAAEAREAADGHDDAMAQIGEQFGWDVAADEPRQQLYQSVRDKLTNAGFTQDAADKQAQLLTARAVTRASRFGQEITGKEYDALAVNQVLPEALAPVVAADNLDLAIEVMKRDRVGHNNGPSLLDWIAQQGGIEDRGGDIASMGGDEWHRGKAFRKKLIRPHTDLGQGDMLSSTAQQNANSPDELAVRAQEAGYFPAGERPTVDDLLEAVGGELRGTARYAERNVAAADEIKAAADDLRALLEQQGLDPDTVGESEIKAAVARYQSEHADGQSYDETFADGPRGRISFPATGYGTGPNVIDLFAARDLSTFIHETGHLWLEELRHDAGDPAAPDSVKADWQAVQDWFVANGHADQGGTIPVDAHELWARGWERYAMEGKSPSSTLRRVFDSFRAWLLSIYQVVENLRAPITPEIRAVMDRLIATDEEITDATEQQNIKALFTDAAQAGMTDVEFAGYQTATTEARDEAFDALLFRTMEAIRRERLKSWKDEEAGVRAEVSARVDARPEFRALAALRAREPRLKLDKAWLTETYGSDALGLLPKGVPPIYAETGATDADSIAELHGFRTGDEMVRALMGIEQRKRTLKEQGDDRSARQSLIDDETAAVMRERHGDPLTDGSIQEEALAAIHNDRQGEVIASELRALSRRSNNQPTPYQLARQWAQRTIAESKVVDSTSGAAIQRYARAAAKAAKLAEAAMLKGDVDETFRQKQAQMLNNALIGEAGKARAAVTATVDRLGKLARRATIRGIDQDYLDQVHGLLEQVNFRPLSQTRIDRQESFEEWANARTAEGHDVVVPPSFAATLGTRNWSRLTVEELLGLDDTVKQIVHLGRLKQKLIDGKDEREFNAVVAEAVDAVGGLRQRPPSDLLEPTWGDRFKAGIASADAGMLKMETVFDWLDGGNRDGVFNRVVFRPIADAQTRENDMLADYHARIREALGGVGKEQLRRWQESFSTPELTNPETGNPLQMRREGLIAIALNMGNEGNAQRLADGYRWNEQSVQALLNRELTAQDWQFVQSVWDIIDTLWPQIAAMERRVNGVAPEKVAARPVETPHGSFAGGYYPAIYDSTRSFRAEGNEGSANELFGLNYTRANTRASSTKARAKKVSRPILLQIGVINRHLGEVIHDITHREAVMQGDRFLSNPRVMKAVDETLGPEIRKQFRPWLKFVANAWAMERAGNEGLGKFIQKARSNATVVGMGFRLSTVLTQIAGYSNSTEVVGARWMAEGARQAAMHPVESFRFVTQRSGEIRFRMDTLDRDIRQSIEQMAGSHDVLSAAKRFAFHGIGYADRMVVIPTWLGGYQRALSEGASEDDAIYAADKAVRQSQGAGSPKDLAAIQRGTGKWGELLKAFTMFYSYMSALYQRQRTLGRDTREAAPRDLPKLLARAWWVVILPPVAAAIPGLLSGQGAPGDDEDWATWVFKQILFGNMTIPVVRDVARPAWDKLVGAKGFDYQLSPLQAVGQSFVKVAGDAGKLARGEETKRATRDALEAAGYATGLVPGQIAAATQFVVDVANGDQDPETVADWYRGLTTGKAAPRT